MNLRRTFAGKMINFPSIYELLKGNHFVLYINVNLVLFDTTEF